MDKFSSTWYFRQLYFSASNTVAVNIIAHTQI